MSVEASRLVGYVIPVATYVMRSSPRLRLCDAGQTEDKALSRWESPPQESNVEASEPIDRETSMLSSYTPYVISRLTYRRQSSGLLTTSARRRRASDGRAGLPRAG